MPFTLHDMMLFSPDTYSQLFRLYNLDYWPQQFFAIGISLVLVAILLRTPNHKPMDAFWSYLALAFFWIWTGITFHLHHYASINWAAEWFAYAFIAQGILLVTAAFTVDMDKLLGNVGAFAVFARILFVAGVIIIPIASIAATDDWRSVQLFGMTPDPTALATLGFVLLSASRTKYLLAIIPALWIIITTMTHWAFMGA